MAQQQTDRLNRMMLGVALSRAICIAAELGIADHIQPGAARTASDLARLTGCHERSLYRTLRFLSGHGVFRQTGAGEFEHSELSAALRSDAEGSYRAAARMFHHTFAAWGGLDHSVRSGEPGFEKVFGKPIFQYLGEHPDIAPLFDAGMTAIHGYETGAMIDAYDLSGIGVLADVGGGNGSLIAAVLRRHPKMRGILFDLGHVASRAKATLSQSGVADRCAVIEGSFFDSIPAGADAYLMRHVLHDWTDEQCVNILGHCRRVIPADGRLLIVECVVPAGNEPSPSKDFDMTMMVFPGGVERTEAEFRLLVERAGFEMVSVTPTSTMVSVVEARPVAAR